MQIELSLCSHLVKAKCNDDLYEIFEANKVNFESFEKNPLEILNDARLLVKIQDK